MDKPEIGPHGVRGSLRGPDLAFPQSGLRMGFTGSRGGMTPEQKAGVNEVLMRAAWLHHGDCLGADSEAHDMALGLGAKVCVHPPLDSGLRAYRSGNDCRPPQRYLVRNRDIVRETQELVAAPSGPEKDNPRSGTWATIRYARAMRRMVTIVWPDGSLEFRP